MKVETTDLPGVLVIAPNVFADERGWFLENWRREQYEAHGIGPDFVQANASRSGQGVLRGLHYQWPEPQGKLVWVSEGVVFDVAVDIRPSSPTFRQWTAMELDAESHRQLWIPEGFAHGFQVLSERATFHYLCTKPYRAEFDSGIAWDDPEIRVEWPLPPAGLSAKDRQAPTMSELELDSLPQ